ncbi:MAG: ribonuclease III [Verrucomicrobia bacterium]|nr:ribonuclease III [Verrucomicrobiota bacterium]
MNPIETLLSHAPEIETTLKYSFSKKEYLILPFVHRSFFNENRALITEHNERLEFLGDSVLGLIVSDYLYSHLPTQSEGHLSHLRSHLVGAESCVRYIRQLGLEKFLMLGKGESVNVGRGRERILADLFEAIIGGIYLDGGLVAAQQFILGHFSPYIDEAMARPLRNWKAELQDYSQKKFQKPPDYQVREEEGPPHSRTFVVAVVIEGIEMGQGEGASKKLAEQAAAEDALRRIEKEDSHE